MRIVDVIEKTKKYVFTFKFKLALLLFIFAVSISSSISYLMYRNALQQLIHIFGNELKAIAIVIADQIDVEKHSALKTQDDANSEYYKDMINYFRRVKNRIPNLVVICTVVRTEEDKTKFRYIVDCDEDPETQFSIGSLYDATGSPEMVKSYDAPSYDKFITIDEQGEWLSGYAPFYGKNGKVAGIVEVDSNAGELKKLLQPIKILSILLLIVSIVVSFFISVLVSGWVSKPIAQFASAMRVVGEGDFDYSLKMKRRDEFGYLANAFNSMVRGLKEGKFVKATFSRYVSKDVADRILQSTDEVTINGERREVSILFSDIRNFTRMSDAMKPEMVVEFLNDYFSEMIDVVFENEGTLDKFMGDGLMAVFGAPIWYKDHAERAVRVALKMQDKLKEFQQKRDMKVEISIGVNTGDVIVGNIGSTKRLEYTCIGSNVNMASRLETLNREYNTLILVSEATYNEVKDSLGENIKVEKIEGVQIKGKEGFYTIYSLIQT